MTVSSTSESGKEVLEDNTSTPENKLPHSDKYKTIQYNINFSRIVCIYCSHISMKTKMNLFFISCWLDRPAHSANPHKILEDVVEFHHVKVSLLLQRKMCNNESNKGRSDKPVNIHPDHCKITFELCLLSKAVCNMSTSYSHYILTQSVLC